MDRQELKTVLAELLEETTGETYPDVTEDQSLMEGLGLDSVDMFSLVVEVQTKFKVKIASEELMTIVTVGDILNLLEAKLASRLDLERRAECGWSSLGLHGGSGLGGTGLPVIHSLASGQETQEDVP